jgi:hypothetical protein
MVNKYVVILTENTTVWMIKAGVLLMITLNETIRILKGYKMVYGFNYIGNSEYEFTIDGKEYVMSQYDILDLFDCLMSYFNTHNTELEDYVVEYLQSKTEADILHILKRTLKEF